MVDFGHPHPAVLLDSEEEFHKVEQVIRPGHVASSMSLKS